MHGARQGFHVRVTSWSSLGMLLLFRASCSACIDGRPVSWLPLNSQSLLFWQQVQVSLECEDTQMQRALF